MSNADIIGSIGVMLMLVVFLLNIADELSNDSPFYIIMNLIGAGCACFASILIKYIPFIILEGTWCAISIWAFIYFVRDFRKPKIEKTKSL